MAPPIGKRTKPTRSWDELDLPEPTRRALDEIANHARGRARRPEADVGEPEAGAGQSQADAAGPDPAAGGPETGAGTTAVFVDPTGTRAALAAEGLAAELGLDLYRVDLGEVVSKYIGETEKNLSRLFDAAESGGAVLFFDEADALFGKRSEVRDSHDRYANLALDDLLQRIEEAGGLAVLASNRRAALDSAFIRRIRFVVEFPFPGGS